MNQRSIRAFWPLLMAFLFLVSITEAQEIILKPNTDTKLQVTTNNYSNLVLYQELSSLRAVKVRTEEGIFSELIIPGFSSNELIGYPKLPVNRKLIEVPANANPLVEVTYSHKTTIFLEDEGIEHYLMPVQPPAPKDGTVPEFVINDVAYNTDKLYGQELVTVDMLGYLRGVRLARVNIAPVKYNPVRGILEIFEDIEVNIRFEDADVALTMIEKEKNNIPYYRSLGRQILNYKSIQSNNRDTITKYPVKYVIVSDRMFEAQLQPLIEWKTRKGFTVVEAYTDEPSVGNTTSSIKSYLQGLYDAGTPDDPAPSFVLFVGDIQQIPAWNGNSGSHVTDLYYCEYTGDVFPEIYYGRMSAQSTAQLQPQIDKTLQYEQYTMPDPSYLNEVVMVAGMDGSHGNDWGNGQINYGTENYFNAAHGITSHTYLYPESGSHSADIIQNISDGVSYGNYTAHCNQNGWGDPSFTISNIPGLQNQDEYCLLVGNCCLSSAYDASECFAEAIVRAEDKGAVGYIGGSNSTYWDPDYYWGVGVGPITEDPPSYEETTLGAYDRTFHDHQEIFEDWYTTQDQMIFAGNLAVTEGSPSSAEYYWEIYCLMGDPSLMIYYSEPPEIAVSYDPLMPLGAVSFTVTTEPYAYVGISMDNILYGAAMADATGIAVVPLDPIPTPGTADVVVTKQNGQPFIGTVIVDNPSGAFMVLDEYVIKDYTGGNGDGLVDYGETIQLDVQLENLGMEDAEDVSAVLTSPDPCLTISDDYEEYGIIPSQSTVMKTEAYTFEVSDTIPDQHVAEFDLSIQDSTGTKQTWNSSFTILVNAPELVAGTVSIDDVQNGNGNGRLDPGEEAMILLNIANDGHSAAYQVIANLGTTSSWININTENVTIDTIVEGGSGQAGFPVTVADDTPSGTSVEFTFGANAGHYACSMEFFLVIGQIPVLVIDFDGNHNSAPAMMSCFDELGVGAELYTQMPDDLDLYASIFVCLGVYSENHGLTQQEGQALADYLDNGGRLYMEGGDTWYYDDETPVHPMFYIEGTADGTDDLGTLEGQDGTFTEGMLYTYSGDNNWIDHIQPLETAFCIFDNLSPVYNTAVAYDGTSYKTIGSSFEFGGLDDGDYTKEELMMYYLDFFDIDGLWTGDKEIEGKSIKLFAYPNPANDRLFLSISSEESQKIAVNLLNAFGQEVASNPEMTLQAGTNSKTLDVSALSAGIYYLNLKMDNQILTKKIVILD